MARARKTGSRRTLPGGGSAGQTTRPRLQERSLWPPRHVLITLCSLAAAILLVRAGLLERVAGAVIDAAVCNIITLILCFSGLVTLLLWLVRESGHAPWVKRAVVGGLLAAVGLAAATLRIERVSGDLVPEFAWRWRPDRDALLPAVAQPPTTASVWTPTPEDFPRFLGPDGTAALLVPRLDPNWEARPPRLLWRRPIGGGWSAFSTCGDHGVTLEQRGTEELVTCCSLETGEPQWSVATPARHQTVLGGVGPRSTPTIRDGVVYATGATGWLHAIDGATGRILWQKDVLADLGIDPAAHAAAVAWGRAGSPLVTSTAVIVPGGGPRSDGSVALVAYDCGTGSRLWTAGKEQIAYCTPALCSLEGREFLVSVNESHVAGYDPATHEEVWQIAWPGHSNSDASCSQAVVVGQRQLFLSKGYGIGAALFELEPSATGAWTSREVWRQSSIMKTKFTNVATRGGYAYGLSDGILECVRLADGQRQWKGGRYGQGQVLLVGDLLVVQSEPGNVVLVEASPKAHAVRGRLAALAGQTWNNPCLTGNKLLVRNAEEAACYELPLLADAAATAGAAP